MTTDEFDKNLGLMDHPVILSRLFFPHRQPEDVPQSRAVTNHRITVDQDVALSCRFYSAGKESPTIFYFHGNGETCVDYDDIGPLYVEKGINLFVSDYRGYGGSDGTPSCTTMIKDVHPLFDGFCGLLRDLRYKGNLFVMGRSLGSAPAIEIAYHHKTSLKGLIVESGFAGAPNQLRRLGVTHLFGHIPNPVGFGNDVKIQDVTIPLLIIHGEEDQIIPADEGRTLFALSGALQKDALYIPRAGHNDLLLYGLDPYMDAIEHFVSKASRFQS